MKIAEARKRAIWLSEHYGYKPCCVIKSVLTGYNAELNDGTIHPADIVEIVVAAVSSEEITKRANPEERKNENT